MLDSETLAAWTRIVGPEAVELLNDDPRPLLSRVEQLGDLVQRLRWRRLLLVIDRPAADASGVGPLLRQALGERIVAEFDGFAPNPTSDQAAAGARAAIASRAEAVLAVGGGSCLDTAKAAAAGASVPDQLDAVCRAEAPPQAALPLVAVPTTSGTGSESTRFATIYVDGLKRSVAGEAIRPAAVVLDPCRHESAPPTVAACTGLDALCHAIESAWAVRSTDESLRYALVAGRLAAAHLRPRVLNRDPDSVVAMMIAASLAGRAIDLTTTTAAHALAYGVTQHAGTPHGHAVALCLGRVAAANALVGETDCHDPRGYQAVRERVTRAAALLQATPDELEERLESLLADLGLSPTRLRVDRATAARLAGRVNPERLSNNPRALGRDGLRAILTGSAD